MAIAPIGPFVRFVLMGATAVWSNWDTIASQFDRFDETDDEPIYGRYVQHVFEFKDYANAFSTRERGMVGIHLVNTTGGDLDTSWVTADYTAHESAFQTFWTARANALGTDCRLVEHRWYTFGPGVTSPNPPARVTTLGSPIVGTGSGVGPHQVASTVTLRTPLRRHWGRFYMPYTAASWNTGGQAGSSTVDAFANDAKTMLVAAATSQGVTPVVYDRNRKAALGVTAIEVDSVPDIVRRRRPRTTGYKKIIES